MLTPYSAFRMWKFIILYTLVIQLSGVDSKAYKFLCTEYPRLYEGMMIHGLPTVVDEARYVVARRDASVLHSGSYYVSGETLLFTLSNITGDIVFEANCSSCFFNFGSCGDKYRFIGSIGSMRMPTDYSNISIWAAYSTGAGMIRMTKPFFMNPTVPDPTQAPTFADPPTIAPTRVSAQRYSVSVDVSLNGLSNSLALSHSETLSDLICDHMSYSQERCKIVSISTSAAVESMDMRNSIWTSILKFTQNYFVQISSGVKRSLDAESNPVVRMVIDNFLFPEWQRPALNSIVSYINDVSSNGYAFAIRSMPYLSGLLSTEVVRSQLVNNSDTSFYEHSCKLGGSLNLFWSLDATANPRFVRGMIQKDGRHWVAGGVVGRDVRTMVHDPNNVVFLYNADTDRSYLYRIAGYRTDDIEVDSREREFTRIVTVSRHNGKTSLQFEQQKQTGISGDPVLNFDSHGSNNFIWAYGDQYQKGHKPDTRGITKVYWQRGVCTEVIETESLLPFLILGYGSAALLVITLLVTKSPWTDADICHFLKFRKVQWLTTSFKNCFRSYNHPQLRDQRAIPRRLWLYNEILSCSIGGALIVFTMSGLIAAFAYLVYVERLYKFKLDPIRCYSIVLAYMGLFSLGISLLTATKLPILQFLFNVPIDRAVKFHKYASTCAMIFLFSHTGLEISFWTFPVVVNYDYTLIIGKTRPFFGVLSMFCFVFVTIWSIPYIRNKNYDRFLSIHSWFVPGVIFAILHFIEIGLFVLGPGLLLYWADLFNRHLYSWLEPKVVARRLIGYEYIEIDVQFHDIYFFHAKNAAKLNKIKMQLLTPASWYYLCVPEVHGNRWHPFTVVGFSGNKIKFIIRRRNDGGWTEALYCRIFADLPVTVRVRGPFGSMKLDVYNPKYKELYLIAGGVGVSTIQSILEALIFYYELIDTESIAPDIKLVIVSQNRSLYEFINKRLEFYSTLKRPRIVLDIYWTSKYVKYLTAMSDNNTDDNVKNKNDPAASSSMNRPFEIITAAPLTSATNPDAVPVDGFVSESYKQLAASNPTSPISKQISAPSTPMTSSKIEVELVSMKGSANQVATSSDISENRPTSKKSRKEKSSAKNSEVNMVEIGTVHEHGDLFTESVTSLDAGSAVVSAVVTPIPSNRQSKKSSSKKRSHHEHNKDESDAKVTSEKSVELEEAQESIDSPSHALKKKSKKNIRATGDKKKTTEDASLSIDGVGVTGDSAKASSKSSSKLFSPSLKSPSSRVAPEPISISDVTPPPEVDMQAVVDVKETPSPSRKLRFDIPQEPPKSNFQDFIVYDFFYENILKKGRPNIESIILNGVNGEFSDGSRQNSDGDLDFSDHAVIICAPPSLIADTRAVCSKYNIDMDEQYFDYN